MNQTAPARAITRRPPKRKSAGVLVAATVTVGSLIVITAVVVSSALDGSPTSSAPSSRVVVGLDDGRASTDVDGVRPERDGFVNEDDGILPDDVSVFDTDYPGVGNLDPALLEALRDAAVEAADDGIEFYVNSGWRSPDYQNHLLREAVAEYGSEEEAARWVATADTSAHVSGDAVDIGSFDARAWLAEHGATYGLCQIYENEPWHFELHPEAVNGSCPHAFPDPTHDPRMQP
jgi:hypothetical protein